MYSNFACSYGENTKEKGEGGEGAVSTSKLDNDAKMVGNTVYIIMDFPFFFFFFFVEI